MCVCVCVFVCVCFKNCLAAAAAAAAAALPACEAPAASSPAATAAAAATSRFPQHAGPPPSAVCVSARTVVPVNQFINFFFVYLCLLRASVDVCLRSKSLIKV